MPICHGFILIWSQGPPGPTNSSTRRVLRDKSLGLVPQIQTSLNSLDKSQILVPATRFLTNMTSSHDETCPRDLLVPSCVPTFSNCHT